ncbi:DUF4124 domain-containing protein [Massilia niabensis]|uniref:DUF4124 domain-containing protein n=1 Tax=Massilia niabensis TaxID=544910 RepID=A0ABW0LBE9_9BURK
MKRLASQVSLILAALAATPAALAGSEILKCVDSAGHVTLTDQPCDSGSRATRLVVVASPAVLSSEPAAPSSEPSAQPAQPQAVAVQRYEAPPAILRQQNWRPRMPNRDRPLARDVATLKAARAQLMLSDAVRQPRPQLATIQ